MKNARLLNEPPPFLKGLSVPEVMVFTGVMTVVGLIAGCVLTVTFETFTPLALCALAGASVILWLPKTIANRIIKWRTGKPTGWLYQRFDIFYNQNRYISSPGIYHNKKEKFHV
ncbi:hypothetical protein TUM4438_10390 [Shewanella sairae]|uniref:TIGR03750 family conjugal transfer protein n=1 Tax=Shewanella sairae TaxID=190310 RepID=A0ABQ4P5V6_9GAMM|nr:DUF3487 family protein [Shewanella sairae]MCL1130473.1 TIGR03750 family conjugal transfer protein [Shewanella sairae]GIU42857.1 hypothetical protein TUM4438_10390 [Shewanella sairae]